VELMQLLVCACETAAMIALIATTHVNQTPRLLNRFIVESASSAENMKTMVAMIWGVHPSRPSGDGRHTGHIISEYLE
jgi:hypothetical protein